LAKVRALTPLALGVKRGFAVRIAAASALVALRSAALCASAFQRTVTMLLRCDGLGTDCAAWRAWLALSAAAPLSPELRTRRLRASRGPPPAIRPPLQLLRTRCRALRSPVSQNCR